MFHKIVNKSKVWSKHGQHKGMAQEVARLNREHAEQPRNKMYASLKDLFKNKLA